MTFIPARKEPSGCAGNLWFLSHFGECRAGQIPMCPKGNSALLRGFDYTAIMHRTRSRHGTRRNGTPQGNPASGKDSCLTHHNCYFLLSPDGTVSPAYSRHHGYSGRSSLPFHCRTRPQPSLQHTCSGSFVRPCRRGHCCRGNRRSFRYYCRSRSYYHSLRNRITEE